VLGNIPLEIVLVFVVLLIISIPRILMIVTRKRRIEKAPSTIKKILSFVSWRDLFFLILGIGLFFYFYNRTFIAYYETNISNFSTFLFLTIAGGIFTLLGGLPVVIKLLSMIWKSIGYLAWKSKKTKLSFIFSEISKDIRYFENITLIFLLVICILIPVLIVPYSKETTLNEQAYFINGSDIRIPQWQKITDLTEQEIREIEGVVSVTNVRLYRMNFFTYEGEIPISMVVINVTNFQSTFYKPAEEATKITWSKINQINNASAMMSKSMMTIFHLEIGDYLEIRNATFEPIRRHNVQVIESFELFPSYYFEEDALEYDKMLVTSIECLSILETINERIAKTADDLYIRVEKDSDIEKIKSAIFEKTGIFPKSYIQVKDSLKTPLYNIFIIEMILSLLVAIIVLVFSCFTTAIKILEKRKIKHDIMNKLGLRVSMIVNMTTIQTSLAAIVPALLIGAAVGFSVIFPTLKQLSYGSAPYLLYVNYPISLMLILFIGVPLLVYTGLKYLLSRDFTKYAPTIME